MINDSLTVVRILKPVKLSNSKDNLLYFYCYDCEKLGKKNDNKKYHKTRTENPSTYRALAHVKRNKKLSSKCELYDSGANIKLVIKCST